MAENDLLNFCCCRSFRNVSGRFGGARRSFTRGTPRGLFGSIGLMAIHSSSVSAYRMIRALALGGWNHDSAGRSQPAFCRPPFNSGVALGAKRTSAAKPNRLDRSKMTQSRQLMVNFAVVKKAVTMW
jgi:hypothetical protein